MDDKFITKKDFKFQELSGTTNSSADTSSKFRHGRNEVPWGWMPLEGEVYVPRNGIGPEQIDIRSRRSSEAFRILLFFES